MEIFFRFFKHVLGCRHLLSHGDNGIELETCAAITACLLIALWTGRQPTLSTCRILCWYFSSWADEEELQAHIAKLKHPPPKADPDAPIYIEPPGRSLPDRRPLLCCAFDA